MAYIHHYKNNFFPDDYDLPFQLQINFTKLIDWWKEQATLHDPFESNRAKEVLKRIEKTPELYKPFDNQILKNFLPSCLLVGREVLYIIEQQ
ncbi:MAG TPA: hypothetical protein VGP55_07455 [Chitinophagaceae bacterium]|nr:hypothetical protein [Chitinophagaceae bacterium]